MPQSKKTLDSEHMASAKKTSTKGMGRGIYTAVAVAAVDVLALLPP
jgi:hypothetical protein